METLRIFLHDMPRLTRADQQNGLITLAQTLFIAAEILEEDSKHNHDIAYTKQHTLSRASNLSGRYHAIRILLSLAHTSTG